MPEEQPKTLYEKMQRLGVTVPNESGARHYIGSKAVEATVREYWKKYTVATRMDTMLAITSPENAVPFVVWLGRNVVTIDADDMQELTNAAKKANKILRTMLRTTDTLPKTTGTRLTMVQQAGGALV